MVLLFLQRVEGLITDSIASPTSRESIYVVLNLLPPSRLEWLMQQSLHVAAVYRRSASAIDPK